MSTPNTIKAQLQELIDISNRVTGKSNTDLTGAVDALIDTYNDEYALRESILARSVTEIESELESLTTYALYNCTKLTRAHFPNLTYMSSYCLTNCEKLVDVYVPKLSITNGRVFQNNLSLEYIDLPSMNTFYGENTFNGCTKLKTFVLRYSSGICELGNINSFSKTLIESGTGYIYVPKSMVEQYKTATNWTTFASQFRALEDYTVDGTIDGELDWDKVNGGAA